MERKAFCYACGKKMPPAMNRRIQGLVVKVVKVVGDVGF